MLRYYYPIMNSRYSSTLTALAILLLIAGSLLAPSTVAAQDGLVPCEGTNCTLCDLFLLVDNIFDFALKRIVPALAVIGVIWGGFVFLTAGGKPERVQDGRKILINTFVGLLIAYGAFVIVGFILGALSSAAGGFFSFENGNIEIHCTAEPTGVRDVADDLDTDAGDLSHEDVRAQFIDARVQIKPGAHLDGVRQRVVNEVVDLKQDCDCTVVVTEGTGGSHAEGTYSHANGYKVDLRSSREGEELTRYVIENYEPIGTRSDGANMWQSPRGAIYALESDHWDVVVRP